jgi:hypothetical protein
LFGGEKVETKAPKSCACYRETQHERGVCLKRPDVFTDCDGGAAFYCVFYEYEGGEGVGDADDGSGVHRHTANAE